MVLSINTFDDLLNWNGVNDIQINSDIYINGPFKPIKIGYNSTKTNIDGTNSKIYVNSFPQEGTLITPFEGLFEVQKQASNIIIQNIRIIFSDNFLNGGGIISNRVTSTNFPKINITACSVDGNFTIGDNSGGIVGMSFTGNISDCYSKGQILGQEAGGICGKFFNGTVSKCYSTGNIFGNFSGGIVGSFSTVNIDNCYSIGNIGQNGNYLIGGIIGSNTVTSSIINCFSQGNISGECGGIFGGFTESFENSIPVISIQNCYSSGKICIGAGIAGPNCDRCYLDYCYSENSSSLSGCKGLVLSGDFSSGNHLGFGKNFQNILNNYLINNLQNYSNIWSDNCGNSPPKKNKPFILTSFTKSPWIYENCSPFVPDLSQTILVNNKSKLKSRPPIVFQNTNVPLSLGTPPPTGIFMRGDPFPITDISNTNYYIVGRDGNGSFYYLTTPFGIDDLKITQYSFSSVDISNVIDKPLIVTVRKKEKSDYLLSTSTSSGVGYFNPSDTGILQITSGNILQTPITFSAVGTMGGSGETLYPGIWYRLSINNSDLSFYSQNCKSPSTKPFCTNLEVGVTYIILDIMLIPLNDFSNLYENQNYGPNTSAKWNNSDCKILEGSTATLPLTWFNSWVIQDQNAPKNCDGPEYLSAANSNCFFTNVNSCKQKYLYTLCEGNGTCGPCLGICSTTENGIMKPCVHDYDENLETDKKSPLMCTPLVPSNPDDPDNPHKKSIPLWAWIVIGIFIFIIIASLVNYMFSTNTVKNESVDNYKSQPARQAESKYQNYAPFDSL